jgi:polyhydroxyalkanoate synthesis regulator phasin
VLVLALLVLPGLVGCQMPTGNSATLDDAVKRLKNVTDEMVTKQDLAAAESANAAAHQQLAARVDPLTTKVERDIPAQLGRLTADLNDQRQRSTRIETALVDDHGSRLRALEEGGRRPIYETTLRQVTPPSPPAPPPSQPDAKSWGIVRIENNMTTWQQLEVNGFPYGVAPLRTVDVVVPAGKATTRLIGFEGTKTWWVGAPDYVQRVVIVPTPVLDSVVRYP